MTSNQSSLLVVDDNESNRLLLSSYLERRGYHVVLAEGGIQGLELIKCHKLDLVLLDVMMPDLDGFGVLDALRQTHSAISLPIIMVTADTERKTIVKALSLGANDYITKPFDLPVVLARIRSQLACKEAEEALRHAKDVAEEAARLKTEFLDTMSHELRTPLTIVLGNLPPLLDVEGLPSPEIIVEIAHDIQQAGNHLLTLINDLLDLSKLDAGHMTLHATTLSAAVAVSDAISSVQIMSQGKELSIDMDVEEVNVYADPLRLQQILLNLLSNAIKFTERGRITIAATQVGRVINFSISDTGCGIPSDCLPYIFDKFRQADGSVTRRTGGSGLGLAITKELVIMHGGEMTVESTLGQGSIFSFNLPAALEEEDESA